MFRFKEKLFHGTKCVRTLKLFRNQLVLSTMKNCPCEKVWPCLGSAITRVRPWCYLSLFNKKLGRRLELSEGSEKATSARFYRPSHTFPYRHDLMISLIMRKSWMLCMGYTFLTSRLHFRLENQKQRSGNFPQMWIFFIKKFSLSKVTAFDHIVTFF